LSRKLTVDSINGDGETLSSERKQKKNSYAVSRETRPSVKTVQGKEKLTKGPCLCE
jgi:hypothetical protein